jgi:hypothetical protein
VVIPVAAVIGAVVALGAGAPLIAAILLHKGAPVSAVAAFMIAAAARGVARRYRGGLVALVVTAIGLGLVLAPLLARCPVPSLHEVGRHAHALAEWIATAVLGAWIVVDLARFGPRSWLQHPTDDHSSRNVNGR